MSKTTPAEIQAAQADPVTSVDITLEQPLKRGDTLVTTVTVRRPVSGELRGLSMLDLMRMEIDAVHKVLPRITQPMLNSFEVAKLDPADTAQFGLAIGDFFVTKAQRSGSLPA